MRPPSDQGDAAATDGLGPAKLSLIGRPGWAAGLALFFVAVAVLDAWRQGGAAAATRNWVPAIVLAAVSAQGGALALSGGFARRDRLLLALFALLCGTSAVVSAPGLLAPESRRVFAAASAALEFAAAAVCLSALMVRRPRTPLTQRNPRNRGAARTEQR